MKPIRLLIAVLLLSGAGVPRAQAQSGEVGATVGATNAPFWTGITFIVLGLWSIWFGLNVSIVPHA